MFGKVLFGSAVLLFSSLNAHSTLIEYEIDFSPNALDPDGGNGSFYWNDATHLISGLRWDFGAGRMGGVDDSLANWTSVVSGGTFAELIFEMLALEDVHPADCTVAGICATGFADVNGLFGWPGETMIFRTEEPGPRQIYRLEHGDTETTGTFSTRRVSVPEPRITALTGIGLAAMGLVAVLGSGSAIQRKGG
ncbi:MAG: hypothetical protein CMN57_08360 [Gammaproteobacteria bacterium]|nr:hypothetical protein [Gammaproteobacteria bacterium]